MATPTIRSPPGCTRFRLPDQAEQPSHDETGRQGAPFHFTSPRDANAHFSSFMAALKVALGRIASLTRASSGW